MKGQKKLSLSVGWGRGVARAGATEVTGDLDLEEEASRLEQAKAEGITWDDPPYLKAPA